MVLSSKHFVLNITDDHEYLTSHKDVLLRLNSFLKHLDQKQELLSINSFNKVVVELSLINSQEIRDINNEYRSKDKATDVLSFPSQDNIRNDEYEVLNDELILGDILICHEVCEDQAKEHKIAYLDEFLHLFVHGLLHLYGYDHELSDFEEKLMEEKEKELINLMK